MAQYVTPWTGTVAEGNYRIEMPATFTLGTTTYNFVKWEDDSTNPARTINLITDKQIIAYYEEVIEMGNVLFEGAVDKQSAPGETVSITITKPDNTTQTISTTTLADGTFAIQYTGVPGAYKAKAHIDEDAGNNTADSDEIAFTIGKDQRTITLRVTNL